MTTFGGHYLIGDRCKEKSDNVSSSPHLTPRLPATSAPCAPDRRRSEAQLVIDTVVPCELLQVFTRALSWFASAPTMLVPTPVHRSQFLRDPTPSSDAEKRNLAPSTSYRPGRVARNRGREPLPRRATAIRCYLFALSRHPPAQNELGNKLPPRLCFTRPSRFVSGENVKDRQFLSQPIFEVAVE